MVAKKFIYKREGEVSRLLSEIFLSQCRKISYGNPSVLCLSKFLVAKKFMDKRVGEVSIFSIENFFSPSVEKIRRGTLWGVTDFGYRKILGLRGLYHEFRSKVFCLRLPKHFVGQLFYAVLQKNSGSEKVYG